MAILDMPPGHSKKQAAIMPRLQPGEASPARATVSRFEGGTRVIIDVHGHTNGANHLGGLKSGYLAARGVHGKGNTACPDEAISNAVKNHVENTLNKVGTDIQFISPRPFGLMHAEKPTKIVHWFAEASNNAVAATVKMAPDRYRAVGALPQSPYEPISGCFEELDRLNEQGFIGVILDPDPTENGALREGFAEDGHFPGLGDEYWFPLYEKLEKLDMPMHIHGTGCKDPWDTYSSYFVATETRTVISMVEGKVFNSFPNLKVVVSHGGGAVPYQLGRYIAFFDRHQPGFDFEAEFKKFYYDAGLYTKEGLDLLFRVAGTDHCMFATENPGTGTHKNPKTGQMMDDTKPIIESIEWLTDQDKKNIFENTARKVFSKAKI
jgi:predicted TIM-barrel fold metal-dependent hydrolase